MVVVQRIVTSWTKRSRGGALAALRNRTPEALVLPKALVATSARCLHHDVWFEERDAFNERAETSAEGVVCAYSRRVSTACSIQLNQEKDGLSVLFSPEGDCGLPARTKEAFLLKMGDWGRVAFNGRFVDCDTGGWWYEKKIFNIGCFEAIAESVFLTAPPDREILRMADLF